MPSFIPLSASTKEGSNGAQGLGKAHRDKKANRYIKADRDIKAHRDIKTHRDGITLKKLTLFSTCDE